MKLHLAQNHRILTIRALGEEGIRVNENWVKSDFIITPEQIIAPWTRSDSESINAVDIDVIIDLDPEIVILGTGARLAFPDTENMAGLINRRIGYEVMDSRSACRTYNLIATEGRKVVAGILAVNSVVNSATDSAQT